MNDQAATRQDDASQGRDDDESGVLFNIDQIDWIVAIGVGFMVGTTILIGVVNYFHRRSERKEAPAP